MARSGFVDFQALVYYNQNLYSLAKDMSTYLALIRSR